MAHDISKNLDTKVQLLYKEMEHMKDEMKDFKEQNAESNKRIEAELKDVKKKLDDKYVTQVEFKPIKQLVYGVVGIILGAVVTALVALVIIQ